MTKDAILRIRLSASDKEHIRAAAERAGLSMSDFLLRAGLAMADVAVVNVSGLEKFVSNTEPIPGQLELSGGLTISRR